MTALDVLSIDDATEADTAALAIELAAALPDGAVLALDGPLGAGKTRLVQALAEACGVEPGAAVSPTFVLVQEYHGRRDIVHVDAYRVRDEDEFLALGAEEYFASGAIVAIEWASRVAGCLPAKRLAIELAETSPTTRRITVAALHPALDPIVARLRTWDASRR